MDKKYTVFLVWVDNGEEYEDQDTSLYAICTTRSLAEREARNTGYVEKDTPNLRDYTPFWFIEEREIVTQ